MSSRPSFSLGRALSAAFTGLPAMFGGAWAILILWWGLGAFLPQLKLPGAVSFAGTFVLFLVQYMTYGALYRTALFGSTAKKEGLGLGGLQLAWPEVRLFLADLIVGLFCLLIVAAVGMVFLIAFNMAGMAEGHADTFAAIASMIARHEGKDWIFIAFLFAAWVFLIFVVLKFSLMGAANVAERRLVTLNALGLSSGNVGKLFIGLLTLFVPFIVLTFVIFAWADLGSLVAGNGGVRISIETSSAGTALSGPSIAEYVVQATAVFLLIPLMIGFLSSAYRQIVASRTT